MNKAPKLQFPPDISVERQGKTYVIFRVGVGEIGGIVLSETAQGDTQLQPYLKVDLDSNKTIVASVAQQMSDALLIHHAQKPECLQRDPLPPRNIPAGTVVFENKVFPCSKCNNIIGKLIFADDITSPNEMKSVAKKFELEASVSPYPVWIIGAPDSDNDDIAKHLTLQITPIKGKTCWEHPDKMYRRLIELDNDHC